MRFNKLFFRELVDLSKPYYLSTEKTKALLLFFSIMVLSIIKVRTNVAINNFSLHFYNALQNYNTTALSRLVLQFVGIVIVLTLSSGYAYYLTNLLSLRWRRWLTQHYLTRWLKRNKASSPLENPDQRISDDINLFTNITLNLFFIFFESILTLIWFGYILWGLSSQLSLHILHQTFSFPGYLLWGAFGYAGIGTAITALIGKNLAHLNYQEQHYNADYRYALIQQRDTQTQSDPEKIYPLFTRIYQNVIAIISVKKRMLFFANFYNSFAFIFGLFLAIPLYLQKKIQLGGAMQISGAFSYVIGACSTLINHYDMLTEWRSVIHRLTEFKATLEKEPTLEMNKNKILEQA